MGRARNTALKGCQVFRGRGDVYLSFNYPNTRLNIDTRQFPCLIPNKVLLEEHEVPGGSRSTHVMKLEYAPLPPSRRQPRPASSASRLRPLAHALWQASIGPKHSLKRPIGCRSAVQRQQSYEQNRITKRACKTNRLSD